MNYPAKYEGEHCSRRCLNLAVKIDKESRALLADCGKFQTRLAYDVDDGNSGAWARPRRCTACRMKEQ